MNSIATQIKHQEYRQLFESLGIKCQMGPFGMEEVSIDDIARVLCDVQLQIETLQHQIDELAKLAIRPQAQGEWEPVEDSEIDDLTYVEDRVLFAETEIGTMRIDFPDGYGVCRRTGPRIISDR